MFTQLRLQGFKSWVDTGDLRLAPITGLFGANSSGKSSILQSLLLLKQTAASRDRNLSLHFGDDTTLVNLGDYASIAHDHDTESTISIGLSWNNERPRPSQLHLEDHSEVAFEVSFSARSSEEALSPIVDRLSYALGGKDDRTTVGLSRDSSDDSYSFFSTPAGDHDPTDDDMDRDTAPINFYGFPFEIRRTREYGSLALDCERQFHRLMSGVRYLGPLRAHPMRQYTWSGDSPRDTGYAGERSIHALLGARNRGTNPPLPRFVGPSIHWERQVARWLQQLGLIHSFTVERLVEGKPYYEVNVKRTPSSPTVLLADVGFGVSQILPVLVICVMAPAHSTIILEQPEIHLHPAVQAGLADILIDAAKRRRVQIILESHSEHLLTRLQRRIAEETISNDEVALHFCENDGSQSTVVELVVDEYGNISNWPRDFFGDEMGEIAAMTEAGLKRQIAADR